MKRLRNRYGWDAVRSCGQQLVVVVDGEAEGGSGGWKEEVDWFVESDRLDQSILPGRKFAARPRLLSPREFCRWPWLAWKEPGGGGGAG